WLREMLGKKAALMSLGLTASNLAAANATVLTQRQDLEWFGCPEKSCKSKWKASQLLPSHFPYCSQGCLHLSGRGQQTRCKARIKRLVRRDAGDNFLFFELPNHAVDPHTVHVEAHDSGRQFIGHRCVQLDVRHFRQPFFELPVEGVDSLRDTSLADGLMELECPVESPPMFEGMKTAGRHRRS